MSDRGFAAVVEDLRTRQVQTDESIVALADAITGVTDYLEAQALLAEVSVTEELTGSLARAAAKAEAAAKLVQEAADLRNVMTAVNQFHRSDRER